MLCIHLVLNSRVYFRGQEVCSLLKTVCSFRWSRTCSYSAKKGINKFNESKQHTYVAIIIILQILSKIAFRFNLTGNSYFSKFTLGWACPRLLWQKHSTHAACTLCTSDPGLSFLPYTQLYLPHYQPLAESEPP